jgi:acetyltransferase-like isoleucine patch superfamily enzyme
MIVWPTAWGALRGVRIHPLARVRGPLSRFELERGAIVSAGCEMRVEGPGTIALGERVWLARDCEIETDARVEIGARTTLQRRCTIYGATRIGADCLFAPDVYVSSGTHAFRQQPHLPIREQERRLAEEGASLSRPVWIQDDCWIGVHAVIAPGVTIGRGSIIGANSVVTRDVPPYTIVAGVPARAIGQRLAWTPPSRVDLSIDTDLPYVLSRAPLLVALRAPLAGESVRATLRCAAAAQVRINGQEFDVTQQTTQLDFAPAPGLPFDSTVMVEKSSPDVTFSAFELVAG